jgi:hypothetical protein
LLNGSQGAGAEAFDCGDFRVGHGCNGHCATPHRFPVHMYGAGPASGDSAAEFRTGQIQLVAKDPEQWRVQLDVKLVDRTVYVQANSQDLPPKSLQSRACHDTQIPI